MDDGTVEQDSAPPRTSLDPPMGIHDRWILHREGKTVPGRILLQSARLPNHAIILTD